MSRRSCSSHRENNTEGACQTHDCGQNVGMAETEELSIITGEPITLQPGRTLTAWLDDEDAVAALLGRNQLPKDDLIAVHERIAAARAARDARPEFVPEEAVVLGDRKLLDEYSAMQHLKISFAGVDWSVEMVDMSLVQSVQRSIKVGAVDERIAPVLADRSKLWDFCLPATRNEPPRGAFTDVDQRGFTVSSVNPNLRIAGTKIDNAEVQTAAGPIRVQAIMFFVNFGNSYINVAHHRGRYFLRDGYHRVTGLLKAGFTTMPAVVVNLPGTYDDLMPGRQVFSKEVSFSARPPLVRDFLDDSVADDYRQPIVRKIIRIRSEEFVVQG